MQSQRPSSTALTVATGILLLEQERTLRHLVPKDASELIRRFFEAVPAESRPPLWALRHSWLRALLWRIEAFVYPGLVVHYALRKRYLEDVVRSCLQDGFNQVIVLGAGLDTLAFRLHRSFPQVQFIEFDHPATLRIKRTIFESHQARGDNLSLCDVDFTRQTLTDVLSASPAFQRGAETVFVVEGVLMYLSDTEVQDLFRSIRAASMDSRVAFTFVARRPDGSLEMGSGSRLATRWLRRKGEPYRSGIPLENLTGYLGEHGLVLRELCTPEVLRRRYLTQPGDQRIRSFHGEYACVADLVPYAAGERVPDRSAPTKQDDDSGSTAKQAQPSSQ